MKSYEIKQMRHNVGMPDCMSDDTTFLYYEEQEKNALYCLPNEKKNNLFFLIEGEIEVYSYFFQDKTIKGEHFFFMPQNSGFSFKIMEKSRFIVLCFDEFLHPGNLQFLEELIPMTLSYSRYFHMLPIKANLQNALNNILHCMSDGYEYPHMSDTIFLLLRSLYTRKEVVDTFYSMIALLPDYATKKEIYRIEKQQQSNVAFN